MIQLTPDDYEDLLERIEELERGEGPLDPENSEEPRPPTGHTFQLYGWRGQICGYQACGASLLHPIHLV